MESECPAFLLPPPSPPPPGTCSLNCAHLIISKLCLPGIPCQSGFQIQHLQVLLPFLPLFSHRKVLINLNIPRPSLQSDILASLPSKLQLPNLPRPDRWQLGVSNDTGLVNYQLRWGGTQVGQRVKPGGIQLGAGPVEPWLPYVGFEHRTPDPPSRCCPPRTRRASL